MQIIHTRETAMLRTLKMAIVTALLIVSASTALAQRTPIDSESLTVPAPLDYGPPENMSEAD
jgi:hypothetical protein